MNLYPPLVLTPYPFHPQYTEPHHFVMLLPLCLFHYLPWTLDNLVVAILYVTARVAGRDLGPSSAPNLISSSQGAARNGGEEGCVVGREEGRRKKGWGDRGEGLEAKEVRGSWEGEGGVISVSASQMTSWGQ